MGDDVHNSLEVVLLPRREGFRILHPHLERAMHRFDFSQDEALHRFNNLLRKYRAEHALVAAGAQEGDTIWVGGHSVTCMAGEVLL